LDNRFQKILVPVRTPDASGRAARVATDLARRLHGELFLILECLDRSVSSEQTYFWMMAEDEDSSRTATADATAIESKSGDLNEIGIPVHRAHLTDQPVAPGIVEYAANNKIDLIVLETYRHRSLGRFVFGGIVGEIVRWSTCPVLTVRKQSSGSSEISFQRILVPVDFSAHSICTLRAAITLAGLYGASIQLIYVHEERPIPGFMISGSSGTTVVDTHENQEERITDALRALFDKDGSESVPVSYHAKHGHVSKEVLDFSVGDESDLIVISSHGLTDNPDFTLGSVAEKVVRRARCPVLTLKARHSPVLKPGGQSSSDSE